MSGSLIAFFRGTLGGALTGAAVGSLDVCRTLIVAELGGGLGGRYVTGVFRQLLVYATVGFAFAIVARTIGALSALPVRDRLRRAPRGEFVEKTVFFALWVIALLTGLLPGLQSRLSGVVALSCFALALAVLVTRMRSGDSAQSPPVRLLRTVCFALAAAGSAAAVFAATQLDLGSLAARATAAQTRSGEAFDSARPDIVFITADTLRADRLAVYGGDTVSTPNLDKLASQSLVYEKMTAQAPWTRASFGSIWTGLTPSIHGATWRILHGDNGEDVPLASHALEPDLPTLPEIFSAAGYLTVGINNNVQTSAGFGFARGFSAWIDVSRPVHVPEDSLLCRTSVELFELRACPVARATRGDYPYLPADRLTPLVAEILTRLESATAPVFLWIHYMDPHVPYDFHDGLSEPLDYESIRKQLERDTQATRVLLERAYDAEISYLDLHLGSVLSQIDNLPRLGGAVIAFTSDHGEELVERFEPPSNRAPGRYFEHRGYGHGHTQYEELLHVPFMLRLPGQTRAGERVVYEVQHNDILPTFASIAGIVDTGSPTGDGRDLTANFTESAGSYNDRTLFAEHSLYGPEIKTARRRELKLILHTDDDSRRIYDLGKDPGEAEGLPYEQFPGGVGLNDALTRWITKLPAAEVTRSAAPGDDGLKRQLEALGYLDR